MPFLCQCKCFGRPPGNQAGYNSSRSAFCFSVYLRRCCKALSCLVSIQLSGTMDSTIRTLIWVSFCMRIVSLVYRVCVKSAFAMTRAQFRATSRHPFLNALTHTQSVLRIRPHSDLQTELRESYNIVWEKRLTNLIQKPMNLNKLKRILIILSLDNASDFHLYYTAIKLYKYWWLEIWDTVFLYYVQENKHSHKFI